MRLFGSFQSSRKPIVEGSVSVEGRELSRRSRVKNTRENITPDHRPRIYRITDSITGWVTDQPRVLTKGDLLPVDDVLGGTALPVSVVDSVGGLTMESDGNMRSSREKSSPERRASPRRFVKEFILRRAEKALSIDDVWVLRKAI